MRWPYTQKTIYSRIKTRFAIIPVVIENEWVWLETYYKFSWEDYSGPNTMRFNTFKAAVEWVKTWTEGA